MERSFKGVWIPKEIWLDTTLGWSEKLLLVEINSLDNEEGCWASNEYFSEFFNLSKDRISKLISSLKNKGYITVDLIYKQGTKKIEKRIVRINYRHRRKELEGIGENNDTPIGENAEDNNTSINNTFNKTSIDLHPHDASPKENSSNNSVRNKSEKNSKKEEKIQIHESVWMTEKEHKKLLEEYEDSYVGLVIQKFNNYKLANNKKYQSDYRALLNWILSDVQKGLAKKKQQPKPQQKSTMSLFDI